MIGQSSMFDDTCPFGTQLDGGIDCIGGDKCRWCCTLPLDARCSNQMFICREGPTHKPTPEPTLQPTDFPTKKPTPLPTRKKSTPSPTPEPSSSTKQSSSSSSSTSPVRTHHKLTHEGGEAKKASASRTSPPTPSDTPSSKKSSPSTSRGGDSSRVQRHRLGASVGVAIAILGSLSLALCITCCERYFRKPRTCCCCFVQFSFTRTSLGETLCCKRVCFVMRADKKGGHGDGQNNHFSDEGSFSESHPCEPVSKAVNLGKDMVGFLLVDSASNNSSIIENGDFEPGAFDPQFFEGQNPRTPHKT